MVDHQLLVQQCIQQSIEIKRSLLADLSMMTTINKAADLCVVSLAARRNAEASRPVRDGNHGRSRRPLPKKATCAATPLA
jgi:hypothetical protein